MGQFEFAFDHHGFVVDARYTTHMAIVTTRQTDQITLVINNGDLQAINDVISKYNFKDEESLLRFALVALLRSESNGIYIDENENKVFLQPSEKLLSPREQVSQTPDDPDPQSPQ